MKRLIFVLILVLAILLGACSRFGASQSLVVQDQWARPGNADGNSAVYFTVIAGGQDDNLLLASTDVAQAAELHMSKMAEDGTMMMEQQENVPIPASHRVAFEPGGLHVMLIGLKGDLKVGDTFQVTLKFEQAGEKTLDVTVREP